MARGKKQREREKEGFGEARQARKLGFTSGRVREMAGLPRHVGCVCADLCVSSLLSTLPGAHVSRNVKKE